MLRVIGCITEQHDLRLVVLAGLLCLFSCATAMGMLERARMSGEEQRLFWLGAAGTVAGCGIWGTHFVAMLAFKPGLPVDYDQGLTALSVVIAAVLCAVGFSLALKSRLELLGGALTGGAISAMHYVGMAAVRAPADQVWDINYVVASVLIGVVFTAIAMHVALRNRTAWGYAQGALFFTLAICGMHFTAMTAVTFVPNPLLGVSQGVLDPATLALAVAAGASLIVALGLTGAVIDYHLTQRSFEETTRLRAHVQELETTKAQLEQTSTNLRAALYSADAANRTKAEFLAAMSHELRTPLNAVIGFSGMILQEPFGPLGNERYRDYIRDISASGAHLLSLINNVLDISKLDSGDFRLEEEELSIDDVVTYPVRMINPQADAVEITVVSHIEPDLPKFRGDRRRLRQVMDNLLANALKFTPANGAIRVEARRHGEGLAIAVSDTGIGMDANDIAKALERFGQIDSRLSRKYEGAGLGLPLAKQLAELHGGRLEILSTKGAGTTVTVTLPADRLLAQREAA